MTDINVIVGKRITLTLNDQHHGIDWLAAETGISERVLLSRLSGRTTWNLSELGEIATALGCGWADMVPDCKSDEHQMGVPDA